MTKIKYLLLLFCLNINLIYSQASINWVSKPFETGCFIENKGQFEQEEKKIGDKILFYSRIGGVEMFFTKTKLIYKYVKTIKQTEKEYEEIEKGDSNIEKNFLNKSTIFYVTMEWQGANSNNDLIAKDTLAKYYTYGNLNNKTGNSTIKANSFSKILYKNIYPNIDIEYVFPKDSIGLKYNIIMHKDAVVSDLKLKYVDIEDSKIDEDGNISIKTPFGNIIEHRPKTYYKQTKQIITSSFVSKNNSILFNLSGYDKGDEIIIDPWVTLPSFTGYNSAYDVDYDELGNVYIYGGSPPYQEIKMNSNGAIQWTYTTNIFLSSPWPNNYGDFAIDRYSESSYIVEGSNSAARVIKLNGAGIQVGLFSGDPNLYEMWRIAYNNCTKKGVIVGGSWVSPSFACVLDTNVSNMTALNVLSSSDPEYDMCLLALDNCNNCFMATAKAYTPSYTSFNNKILKCPANTLTPLDYVVSDNHSFIEGWGIGYINNGADRANGFNGMDVNSKYLYTYDGKLIQRWNKNTGVLINTNTISSSTKFLWGGIAVDDCENVFIGFESSIKMFDINFSLISTITMPDTVYDIRLSPNGLLYSSGKGFVSSISNPIVNNGSCVIVCDSLSCIDNTISSNSELFFPNTFSPNGDGSNDFLVFKIDGTNCFDCKIYDRWGILVYESQDSRNSWDGKVKQTGKLATDGVYYYIIEYCDSKNIKKNNVGFIQLINQ